MMLSQLAAYYDAKGIAPEDFRCRHEAMCSAESPQFTTAKASFVGTEYEKGSGPRLLFLSLDSGSAEGDPRRKTIEAVRDHELRENIAALNPIKHWYLTHELAWKLLRHFHPGLTTETTSPYFAHVNSAKCCLNKPGREKAHRTLFRNCRKFIPGELEVLEPDIIVTQGNEARDVIVKGMKGRIVKYKKELLVAEGYVKKARCETGLLDLVTGKQTLWLQTYHPNSWGLFNPQKTICWPLYEDRVKQFVARSVRHA